MAIIELENIHNRNETVVQKIKANDNKERNSDELKKKKTTDKKGTATQVKNNADERTWIRLHRRHICKRNEIYCLNRLKNNYVKKN